MEPAGTHIAQRGGNGPSPPFCDHCHQGLIAFDFKPPGQINLQTPKLGFDLVANNLTSVVAQKRQTLYAVKQIGWRMLAIDGQS